MDNNVGFFDFVGLLFGVFLFGWFLQVSFKLGGFSGGFSGVGSFLLFKRDGFAGKLGFDNEIVAFGGFEANGGGFKTG